MCTCKHTTPYHLPLNQTTSNPHAPPVLPLATLAPTLPSSSPSPSSSSGRLRFLLLLPPLLLLLLLLEGAGAGAGVGGCWACWGCLLK